MVDKTTRLKPGRWPVFSLPQRIGVKSKTIPQISSLFLKNAENFSSEHYQNEENLLAFLQTARKRQKKIDGPLWNPSTLFLLKIESLRSPATPTVHQAYVGRWQQTLCHCNHDRDDPCAPSI